MATSAYLGKVQQAGDVPGRKAAVDRAAVPRGVGVGVHADPAAAGGVMVVLQGSLESGHALLQAPGRPLLQGGRFAGTVHLTLGAEPMARKLAGPLGQRLGQTVIVDNRAGAGTAIGATAVAKSAPDGYTLLISSNTTFTVNAALKKNLPYDPQKDFESIGLIGSSPLVLLAHPKLHIRKP